MTDRHTARGVNGRFVSTKNAPGDAKSDFKTYDDLPVRATGVVPAHLAYQATEPIVGPAKDENPYPHIRARRAKLIDAESGQHLGDVIVQPDRAGRKRALHEAAAGDDDVIKNLVS